MSREREASRGEAMTLELLRGVPGDDPGVRRRRRERRARCVSRVAVSFRARGLRVGSRSRSRRAPVDASTNGPRSMSSRDFEPAPGIGAVGDRTGLIAGAFSLGVSAAGAVGSAAVGAMASPFSGALSLVRGGGSRSDLVALSDARVEVVLTPKNIQALRTLFNVAHRLAATLGTAWEVILETLGALEREGGFGPTDDDDGGESGARVPRGTDETEAETARTARISPCSPPPPSNSSHPRRRSRNRRCCLSWTRCAR